MFNNIYIYKIKKCVKLAWHRHPEMSISLEHLSSFFISRGHFQLAQTKMLMQLDRPTTN